MEKRTYGNETTIVDTGNPEAARSVMRPNTRLVHIETPGNPTMTVCDIWGIAEIAHAGGTLLSVDNTFASPYNQRPLELGADFSVSVRALKTQRTSSPTWTKP